MSLDLEFICLFKEAKTSLKLAGKSDGTEQQVCGNKESQGEFLKFLIMYMYIWCIIMVVTDV